MRVAASAEAQSLCERALARLGLAIGSGMREPTWYKLPPGKRVTMSWPLGEALFDAPGDYPLVPHCGGQQATADITVTE